MIKIKKITLSLLSIAACLFLMASQIQAATLTVTKTADTNDGMCNADCSLREAVAASVSGDTIIFSSLFSSPQSIVLTQGQILITKSLTITGPGANLLDIGGNNASRVFTFSGNSVTVNLSNLTIAGGNAQGFNQAGQGGGILNIGAALNLTDLKIVNNRASGLGGGLANTNNGTVTITNLTVSNNLADNGGGIYNAGSRMSIINSVINNNTAALDFGGGIDSINPLTITNSTVSGNRSNGSGGGICTTDSLTITNVTISNNTAVIGGGGIRRITSSTLVRNTIIANNTATGPSGPSPDVWGSFLSQANNLIGNSSGSSGFTDGSNGDKVGSASSPINPLLGPLQNNGGFTQTHALLAGSPAIDAGNNCVVLPAASGGCLATPLTTDQRGAGFPRLQGSAVDIGAFEFNAMVRRTRFDFNGDGKTDYAVSGFARGISVQQQRFWYILINGTNEFRVLQLGLLGDREVPEDYDGDGKTDVAVYRDGTWYLQRSSLGFTGIGFGAPSDIPMPADFDGDGKSEIAVFRPSNGVWYILNLANNQFTAVQFGQAGDVPVAADYDGDGKSDIAVFRNGAWYLQRSQLGFTGIAFGQSGDKPVPADYDGDGKADVAVFRPSNGTWYLQRSTQGFTGVQFGSGTDKPVAGDYDGDGKADIAVWRPSNGVFYVQQSQAGFTALAFGQNGDTPVASAYVP